MSNKMNNEFAEETIQNILKLAKQFEESHSYLLAMQLATSIGILRYIIGEKNYLALDYFRRVFKDAMKVIDEHENKKEK